MVDYFRFARDPLAIGSKRQGASYPRTFGVLGRKWTSRNGARLSPSWGEAPTAKTQSHNRADLCLPKIHT